MESQKYREILRRLAMEVREIADLPEMDDRKKRWYDFIDLKPERPMVLCYPEGSWKEIFPQDLCQCEDEKLRKWEMKFRSQIYWWNNIHDDNTLEPWFDLSWHVTNNGYGLQKKVIGGGNKGSYKWEPAIKNFEEDFPKLHIREFQLDKKATEDELELADSLFGDILPARLRGNPRAYGMTWLAVDLIGLENLMLYMYDEPENLHKLMAFIRDDFMNALEWYEKEGLLLPYNENDYVGSGGVAYTRQLPKDDWKEGTPLRLKDIWGCAESQETVGVSPSMFREFILPYQEEVLSKTGLNHYGCCEGLHDRIDDLLKIPNMRRFSVSPWCNQEIMIEKLKKDYIFSRKPNPTLVCSTFDEKLIREDLRNTLNIAGEGVLEFILKDTHTVENEPSRIKRWVELAYEEIYNYMG